MPPSGPGLRRITELARSVASALELDAVLKEVTAAVVALRENCACVIRLVDRPAGGYRLAASGGVGVYPLPAVLPFGQGLAAVVATTRRPLLVSDAPADPRTPAYARDGLRRLPVFYGTPIEAGEEVLGVLVLLCPTGAPPTDEEQEALRLFAGLAAVAIRNARLFAESEARRRTAEALAEVARVLAQAHDVAMVARRIVESVHTVLGIQSAALFRLDPATGDLIALAASGDVEAALGRNLVMSAGTGISGLAVRERRLVVTPNLLADPRLAMTPEFRARLEAAPFRAALGVPLLVEDRVVGALVAADRPGRVFGDDEIRLTQSFADQAALALERAQLYDEANRGRREAEVIAEVARRLAASLELSSLLQRVVEAARELTGSDLAHIALRDPSSGAMVFDYWAGGRYEGHQTFQVLPGKGVGGQVLLSGQPFRTDDYARDPRLSKDYVATIEAEGIVASMAVPIVIEERVDGLLFVDNRARRPFTDRDEAVLVRLADHAGIAIRNARLLAREQSERARLDTVLRQMPAGVVIAEAPSGRLILGNAQVEEIWRAAFTPASELEDWVRYLGFHPDGRPYRPEEWPLARSIRAGEVVTGEEIEFVRGDGSRGTMRVSAAPIRDAEGKIVAGACTFYDVTEQKRAAAEREQLLAGEQAARAEAEAANRAKDEFLAMLGHELRNPLSAITSAASVLRRGSGDRELVNRLQAIIERQTQQLGRLVDDLLDVARLGSGKVALQRGPLDLKEVAERALAAFAQAGRTAAHDVGLVGESVVVNGDPMRLEQVVANLLDNALKYTPAGGYIRVTVGPEGDEAVLRVQDTGAGIPAEMLPRIFDLFVQAGPPVDRTQGGLGLGLTLTRRLVELHGGGIIAASRGPGQGSEFVVRLPRLPARPATTAAVAAEPAAGATRTVLVIEDNRDVRDGLRVLLETWGHRVIEASDGLSGVAQVRAGRPDIALIDIGLPGLDGYAVAREIRALPGMAPVMLVALTGYGQPADRRRAFEAGFDAHLVKPVEPADLARVLAEAAPSR
ncbi:MAG TPA: GAF domain-containing protein [Methylomirabilota bacterium]|jgi:signal transduction histidine kinase/ActR/RegA family two-component response regulator/uncharacterized protein YigA (DUF484 family)|nr:GAF domain-containing protein [Methylomirabilota bacterium]